MSLESPSNDLAYATAGWPTARRWARQQVSLAHDDANEAQSCIHVLNNWSVWRNTVDKMENVRRQATGHFPVTAAHRIVSQAPTNHFHIRPLCSSKQEGNYPRKRRNTTQTTNFHHRAIKVWSAPQGLYRPTRCYNRGRSTYNRMHTYPWSTTHPSKTHTPVHNAKWKMAVNCEIQVHDQNQI